MMNTFCQVFQVSCSLCNKRQIYIEFRVFWKEKKEELEVQKTRMGSCPFSGLCHDREISIATENANPVLRHGFSCRDMVLRPGARPGLGAGDKHARAVGMRA